MKWSEIFKPITYYSYERVTKYHLNKQTADFLVNIGLPRFAAPFLSFVENNDSQYEGLLKLTDYFDFLESDFEKYIVIGSNGNGDFIAIDTADKCRIKLLDHENYFSEDFINNSLEGFCQSLIIYQDFIEMLQEEFGEDALFDNKYSDQHLSFLKNKLVETDPESMNENCFWSEEISILVANRDE